jgi:hypothetical protein
MTAAELCCFGGRRWIVLRLYVQFAEMFHSVFLFFLVVIKGEPLTKERAAKAIAHCDSRTAPTSQRCLVSVRQRG